MKANMKIRENAKRSGVCLWQIADKLGIQESGLSKKLCHELPPQERDKILAIIDNLAKKAEKNA